MSENLTIQMKVSRFFCGKPRASAAGNPQFAPSSQLGEPVSYFDDAFTGLAGYILWLQETTRILFPFHLKYEERAPRRVIEKKHRRRLILRQISEISRSFRIPRVEPVSVFIGAK